MSTDRELLELAAKAAGINARWHDFTQCFMRTLAGQGLTRWEPLTDDGDALRLMAALRIDVMHWDEPDRTSGEHPSLPQNSIMQEVCGGPMWATRRAIVRAAAAMASRVTARPDEPKGI